MSLYIGKTKVGGGNANQVLISKEAFDNKRIAGTIDKSTLYCISDDIGSGGAGQDHQLITLADFKQLSVNNLINDDVIYCISDDVDVTGSYSEGGNTNNVASIGSQVWTFVDVNGNTFQKKVYCEDYEESVPDEPTPEDPSDDTPEEPSEEDPSEDIPEDAVPDPDVTDEPEQQDTPSLEPDGQYLSEQIYAYHRKQGGPGANESRTNATVSVGLDSTKTYTVYFSGKISNTMSGTSGRATILGTNIPAGTYDKYQCGAVYGDETIVVSCNQAKLDGYLIYDSGECE